jgi:hypothetical protein
VYTIYHGKVARGFQFASGEAVNRKSNPSPFSDGTLRLQERFFRAKAFDMIREIPNLFWGTINVEIDRDLTLVTPDVTVANVDWTREQAKPGARIAPETFSFVRCCLAADGVYHSGMLYYPHPETKPTTNEHRFNVLEVLSHKVEGLAYGDDVAVICRADAFKRRS